MVKLFGSHLVRISLIVTPVVQQCITFCWEAKEVKLQQSAKKKKTNVEMK